MKENMKKNMQKQSWKPGNMLYPLPVVLVSCQGKDGKPNLITIAWTGTICSDPPMVSISVRKERHSYDLIRESGEFVINLTTEDMARATDYCGVRSGRKVDKFAETGLTPVPSTVVRAPMVGESPVSIECRVKEVLPLGSHDMFVAEVVAVNAAEAYMDADGRFDLSRANPIVYSHGTYFGLGKELGTFGYSVKKS